MTSCGAVFCRLVLILGLVSNVKIFAFADEDVCKGKNPDLLTQFFGIDEVKKVGFLLLSLGQDLNSPE